MSDIINKVGMWREILLRLPAVCLLRFRSVCKGWCSVIDDPCFIKAHTNHQQQQLSSTFIIRNSTGPPFCPLYYIDLEDLNFTTGLQTIPVNPLKLTRRELSCLKAFPVAACNGLILIAPVSTKDDDDDYGDFDNEMNMDPKGTWEIMNPLTQEHLKLPQPNNINYDRVVGLGIGYYCAADDYKVVVIESKTHVYSLRLDKWRTIGSCPFDDSFRNERGVFLGGALHWVSDDRIIVFEVRTESYRQLALPSFDRKSPFSSMHLEVLSGCLFLSYTIQEGCKSWIWVMNDYGGKYTWIKLLSWYFDLRPVAYVKNKRRVLAQRNDRDFVWFDVESTTSKRIEIHGISYGDCSAQVCVGSLFRLHDSCARRFAAAASSKRRKRDVTLAAHNKLTFCVSDCDKYNRSHDNCYPNWYHSSDLESTKVCGTSFDPAAGGDSASTLSWDICREIFLRSPAKSVVQFRAVCKDWKTVIDDPCFVKAHTNNQLVSNNTIILIRNKTGPPFYPLCSFNLDELDFTKAGLQKITVTPHEFTSSSRFPCLPVAECNGLMLVAADDQNEKLQLWNPLTNEHLELPQVQELDSNPSTRVGIGLGYEQATDDYKVVVIHREEHEEKVIYRTHVYSLRSDSWNMIAGDLSCGNENWCLSDGGRGVFLCGALHWFSEWEINITVLDLTTESYRQINGPRLGRGRDLVSGNTYLDVLGGCLVVTDIGFSHDGDHYDLWVMKDYGSEDSWSKLFTYDEIDEMFGERKFCGRGDELRPLTYMKNKTQILLQDEKGFYLHDVESDSTKNVIRIHGLPENISSQIFAGSIFRLHDNCGVGGKTRSIRKSNMKRPTDTELYFCVRNVDPGYYDYGSHDSCYTVDSNWYCSSSENED